MVALTHDLFNLFQVICEDAAWVRASITKDNGVWVLELSLRYPSSPAFHGVISCIHWLTLTMIIPLISFRQNPGYACHTLRMPFGIEHHQQTSYLNVLSDIYAWYELTYISDYDLHLRIPAVIIMVNSAAASVKCGINGIT